MHRQKRWLQERRLALPAVRVAGEDGPGVAVPTRHVDAVGIVAQHQRRELGVAPRQCRNGIEATAPEVSHADDLQSIDRRHAIDQNGHASGLELTAKTLRDLRVQPPRTVVVVAQRHDGAPAATWEFGKQSIEVVVDAGFVTGEVAGVDDEIGRQIANSTKRFDEVVVVDLRADVYIGYLDQPRAVPGRGQSIDR